MQDAHTYLGRCSKAFLSGSQSDQTIDVLLAMHVSAGVVSAAVGKILFKPDDFMSARCVSAGGVSAAVSQNGYLPGTDLCQVW